jgi:hypothetical protein
MTIQSGKPHSETSDAWNSLGATRVSVPGSLGQMGKGIFHSTPLKMLDLSACAGIVVKGSGQGELVELSLPRDGFAAAAKAFLPGTRIEVLRAEIDQAEINELLPHLGEWGVDQLRVISPRVEEYEWQGAEQSVLVELADPVTVRTPASVTITAWREILEGWKQFVRVIDLSGLAVDLLPDRASLKELRWLERAVLRTGLRGLPRFFLSGCWRLGSIGSDGTALEVVGTFACSGCRSLATFRFPPTVRTVCGAFGGTSIRIMDLSGTQAEDVSVWGMGLLVELILPRRCVLGRVFEVPSLRRVAFGASRPDSDFFWHPREVRFEGLTADTAFSPGLLGARVYGEVACEFRHETFPVPPP